MLESIKKKLEEQNKDNDPKNMSFDFKLMFVYHIAMMILFASRPVENPAYQLYLALFLLFLLVAASTIHKIKAKWRWPGLSISGFSLLLLNLVVTYAFLAFAAYAMTAGGEFPPISLGNIEAVIIESWRVMLEAASNPVFTPWYLAGMGIFFMNSAVSLKLSTLKKSEFEAQCSASLQAIKNDL